MMSNISINEYKSGNSCCVHGCTNKAGRNAVSLHKFPKKNSGVIQVNNKFGDTETMDIREAWIKKIRNGKTTSNALKVCSAHFTKFDFIPTARGKLVQKPRLKKIAVPSLNLPEVSHDKEIKSKKRKSESHIYLPITNNSIPQSPIVPRKNKKELDTSYLVKNGNIERSVVTTKEKNERTVEEQGIQHSDNSEEKVNFLTSIKSAPDLDRNLSEKEISGRNNLINSSESKTSQNKTPQIAQSDVQMRVIPVTLVPINMDGTTNVAKYKFDEICRCCVVNKGEVNLFNAFFQNKSMSDLIQFCTNETISPSDNLPRTICNVCMQLLISAFTFMDKFKSAQVHIRQIGELLTENCQQINKNTHITDNIESSEEIRSAKAIGENNETSSSDSTSNFKSKFKGLRSAYNQLCTVLSQNKNLLKETDHLVEKILEDLHDEEEVTIEGDENCPESFFKDAFINVESCKETANNQSMNAEGNYLNPHCKTSGADKKITGVLCLECPQRLLSEKAVERHYKETRHAIPDRFKCNKCSATFALKIRYKKHIAAHREIKSLCEICGTKITATNLKRHLEIHSTDKSNVCHYCGKAFTQMTALNNHINGKHSDKSDEVLCALCGKLLKKLSDLNSHLNTQHKDDNIQSKLYGCEVCLKYFATQYSLLLHKKYTHSEERRHRRRYNVTQKIQPKIGKKYIYEKKQCPICQKRVHQTALKAHMHMHQSVRPYKCTICSKRFRQSPHLKSHMNIHSGNKPYKCQYCQKRFRHNTSLAIHIRSHTGETPYKCPVCDKGFTHSSTMKKHHLIHLKIQKQNKYKSVRLNEC